MTDTPKKDYRSAWDADTMGYGKHSYHHVDPDTINPEDYATNMRGEQEVYGDKREYNSAHNEKHPENNVRLEDLARPGTVFMTEAEDHHGYYMVTRMPAVHAPKTYVRCAVATKDEDKDWEIEGEELEIDTALLGCSVDETNHFKQVKTTIVVKGKVDKHQRERLTKR